MKVALYQLSSQLDYKINLAKIELAASKASLEGAKALFLPECFYSFSDGKNITPFSVTWKNKHYKNISQLAKKNNLYLLGGSVIFEEDNKFFNRSLNFNNDGELINYYDKIKMFKVNDPEITIDESRLYKNGISQKTIEVDKFKIGLNICFDLRFSKLAQNYIDQKCNILSYSSAFTEKTGRVHWEILLRARAIESQSFVIACNQWGLHNNSVKTYGHSMVIDPWGRILADALEGEKLLFADVDFELIKKVRSCILMD